MKRTLPCLLVLLALFGAACSRAPKEAEAAAAPRSAPPLEIKVAAAERRQVEKAILATGSLLPDETVNLSSEIAGTVARVFVDFGQPIRKGQVLVELDQREFQFQLERSRAALSQALARIGLPPGHQGPHPDVTPSIRQAQAQAEDARSKFESAARLVTTGDISRERYTELEKTYRAREAALQAARDDLRTQIAAIEGLRAEVKLAEKHLSDVTLRAPFDGAVAAKLASAGQFVKENVPVLTLVKTSPLRLRVDVPESAIGELRAGTPLTFTTSAVPNHTFRAVTREVNPSLDAKARSLAVEARLVESDPRLKPGLFVQARVVVASKVEVVVVPKDAVYTVAGLTKIFTVRDGAVVEHRVQPGMVTDTWVEIPGGLLKPGDLVATSRLDQLINGQKVQTRS